MSPPQLPPAAVAYASADPNRTDLDQLRLLAVFHYVWAALLALFACFGLFYIAMGVAVMSGAIPMGPPPRAQPPAMTATTMISTPATISAFPAQPQAAAAVAAAPGQQAFESWFGIFFIVMGGIILLGGWTLAICTLIAGRALAKQRRRTFAIVIAAINCMMVPLGTVLGVFTLVVLLRESVRVRFDGEST